MKNENNNENIVRDPQQASGKWFCCDCKRPINNGYSYKGRCVVCAEPHYERDSANGFWESLKAELKK